jgi:hypothetical protein
MERRSFLAPIVSVRAPLSVQTETAETDGVEDHAASCQVKCLASCVSRGSASCTDVPNSRMWIIVNRIQSDERQRSITINLHAFESSSTLPSCRVQPLCSRDMTEVDCLKLHVPPGLRTVSAMTTLSSASHMAGLRSQVTLNALPTTPIDTSTVLTSHPSAPTCTSSDLVDHPSLYGT